jgi:hypothetical protein
MGDAVLILQANAVTPYLLQQSQLLAFRGSYGQIVAMGKLSPH